MVAVCGDALESVGGGGSSIRDQRSGAKWRLVSGLNREIDSASYTTYSKSQEKVQALSRLDQRDINLRKACVLRYMSRYYRTSGEISTLGPFGHQFH